MKKIYLLAFALGAFAFSSNAQIINDDLESYSLGPVHEDHWSSWSGDAGAEDLIIQTAFANSGTQSGVIGPGDVPNGGPQDALLLLGNRTSGTYYLRFQMYIPAGKSGYFNFQGTTTANGGAGTSTTTGNQGIFNSPNLVFNNAQSASGAPGLGGAYGNIDDADPIYTWTYPEDQWFPVDITFNVDAGLWTMTVAGDEIPSQLFDDENVLGGIDFFAIDPNNEYYIDDVLFDDEVLGTNDFSADAFSVYPNPVKDILNISSKAAVDSVVVYDILGKQVLSAQPNAISPKVDMSGLTSGAYLVNVTIGNASKTVKVIK
ncbi:T9SS type A sorting domain-containing protein [Aequorivita echinoideorum]|uniref:T9SS type A sorting domain-containing protein n=1 Tax=Aequorivita echinoideorum TaxID=1549647 RepID=A0ABS5S4Y3_9FLAO|nr:T9SS type A sorting domain-containing protein [Aequorivita echinoideorum]MBT0608266.1 T9SS type A sorting domain-containing protein [Aequorivita echinoideorum]